MNNWLSSKRPIPEAKLALIQRLMADDAADAARQKQLSEPTNQVFSVEVSLPRFRRYNAAAAARRQTMEQWTIDTLDAAVENISATIGLEAAIQAPRHPPPLQILSLNEQPAKYTTGPSHGDHDPVTHDTRPLRKAAQEHHEP